MDIIFFLVSCDCIVVNPLSCDREKVGEERRKKGVAPPDG